MISGRDTDTRASTFSRLATRAVAFAVACGVERAEVLLAAGVSERGLGAVTTFEPVIAVWRLVCARFPEEPLGLRRAAALEPGEFGAMGRAVQRVATALEAIRLAVRYQRVCSPFVEASVREHHDRLAIDIEHDPRVMANPEWMEFIVAGVCRMLCLAAPTAPSPMRVHFRHVRRHPRDLYREILGCVPDFQSPWYRLEYPCELSETSLVMADPEIVPDLCRHLDAVVASMAEIDRSTSARAAASLRALLPGPSGGQLGSVARALQMSRRSLQRALKREGTCFRDLLEMTRRDRALELVRSSALSNREIARELGYEDPNCFFRAFRSWAGATPAAYRSVHTEAACRVAAVSLHRSRSTYRS